MEVKNENQSVLSREIKIVPAWAWGLTGIVFLAAQIFFNVGLRHETTPPAPVRALIGVLAGVAAGIFLLFVGYVNRDAKRRGMSPLLWTLVVFLIPNALGFILYFVLRQPLQSACPQCGTPVQPGFSFCPRCSYKLNPSCPQCQRAVGVNDVYCPYCGTSMRTAAAPSPGSTPA